MMKEITDHQLILYMKKFSELHRQYAGDICTREAKCLELQVQHTMLPPRSGDLLVGRKTELPVGFTPQSSRNSVGYYCDEQALLQISKKSDLTEEDKHTITELITYWKDKTTNAGIKARYTEEQLEYLSEDDYVNKRGTAFPLYRMSGAQMSPVKLLTKGLDTLIEEIINSADKNPPFYAAAASALQTFRNLCISYHEHLLLLAGETNSQDSKEILDKMAANLLHIAHKKPETFWQAAQLSYLYYLVSGTYNYGRMDEYLGNFYAHDLDEGISTEEEALSVIKSLWSLIIERDTVFDGRVILGGKDRPNPEAADRFAIAAMEASRQLKDVLPQLTLRCYEGMNPAVYEKALEVIGEGTTFPMLYNDDLNIPCVAEAFSISLEEASAYVPFGCGEYVIYNKSFGTPSGIINYLQELNTMIYEGETNLLKTCPDFPSFYESFLSRFRKIIPLQALQEKQEYEVCAQDAPYLYYSILFDDCLAKGKPVFDGGIRYLGGTLEGYGNINTSDSLTAIKKLVYEEKKILPDELAHALRCDFKGYEELHRQLLEAPKYGNDDSYADSVAVQFHTDICDIIRDCQMQAGLHSYLQVIINNHTNTIFGLNTGASADGRHAHTFMANANNPTGGMDKNGITALLNSLVKLSPRHHAGSVQNMRFSREMFGRLLPKTKGLLSGYFRNGGSQAMITVLNRGDLEQAMVHPEKYQNLVVRVGGFSARFVELSKDDQAELLSRTLY
ncbi:Choline trimethylamine-lyase [Blautia producta]|uniref:Choline trimethylamine-lyase n=1 Tax=Blautia producta TaxID=33035 RepID=A0A4V0Z7R8_9FIRM|nr:pyruvate formate lyase family protein [Blautia producta]QBE97748.1 Choline trimethylamine-lyase [Blautia producta]